MKEKGILSYSRQTRYRTFLINLQSFGLSNPLKDYTDTIIELITDAFVPFKLS